MTGQTIGLLGGSFDPPHRGHVNITLEALKRFQLDQVWWLVSPGHLRRNLVIEGINLAALKGRQQCIGEVVIELTGICAPCSRMEEAFGPGGYSAVRGHGGWCASALCPGEIVVGDPVVPV